MPELRLVLDQPKWFMQGQLTISLFAGETRIYSLAFSFRLEPTLVAYIGAIQGRDLEGILDLYRQITKALHGMRPRDFLVEVFCMLCRVVGVKQIYAIADSCRIHRSPYFGHDKTKITVNYDEIWQDRGGAQLCRDFFTIPITGSKHEHEEIPPKKRSMYRKHRTP